MVCPCDSCVLVVSYGIFRRKQKVVIGNDLNRQKEHGLAILPVLFQSANKALKLLSKNSVVYGLEVRSF